MSVFLSRTDRYSTGQADLTKTNVDLRFGCSGTDEPVAAIAGVSAAAVKT